MLWRMSVGTRRARIGMMFIHFDGSSGRRVQASGIAKTGSANCANCANSLAVTFQNFRDAPLMPVAGVKEAVLALQAAGVATCVASSGTPEKMRFTLGLTGLWDLFDGRIFSSSQVPRGKPFPDLFLHAAIAMDVQPFDCTVVEDSVPGTQAARAAGMRALAYAGAPYANRAALAAAGAELFDDMKVLPGLVLR